MWWWGGQVPPPTHERQGRISEPIKNIIGKLVTQVFGKHSQQSVCRHIQECERKQGLSIVGSQLHGMAFVDKQLAVL